MCTPTAYVLCDAFGPSILRRKFWGSNAAVEPHRNLAAPLEIQGLCSALECCAQVGWEIQSVTWNSLSSLSSLSSLCSQSQSFGAAIASRAESTSLLSLHKVGEKQQLRSFQCCCAETSTQLTQTELPCSVCSLCSFHTLRRYLQPSHFRNWKLRQVTILHNSSCH